MRRGAPVTVVVVVVSSSRSISTGCGVIVPSKLGLQNSTRVASTLGSIGLGFSSVQLLAVIGGGPPVGLRVVGLDQLHAAFAGINWAVGTHAEDNRSRPVRFAFASALMAREGRSFSAFIVTS